MGNILRLKRVGKNYWGHIAYKDKESGKYYLDIDNGRFGNPQLYTCSPSDDIDGEPGYPLKAKYEIINLITADERLQDTFQHEYMLLSRLQSDCIGYLSEGDCRYHQTSRLWAKDERKQIDEMRRLWNILPIKPEWLTMEQIEEYAMQMECSKSYISDNQ